MIVVLGRPLVAQLPLPDGAAAPVPAGPCVAIARAAVAAGARVELVGSIGDDAEGDAVVVGLARAGVGHAALLRDPAARTPHAARPRAGILPRLDRDDIELGLGYLLDFSVLLLAELLDPEAEAAALDAAAFRAAEVVAVLPHGTRPGERLAATATVFEAPADSGGAFAAMVGRYAAEIERGAAPADGFARAAAQTGWERRQ
jgi:hypothetical protein